jgi:hypothetical protein
MMENLWWSRSFRFQKKKIVGSLNGNFRKLDLDFWRHDRLLLRLNYFYAFTWIESSPGIGLGMLSTNSSAFAP